MFVFDLAAKQSKAKAKARSSNESGAKKADDFDNMFDDAFASNTNSNEKQVVSAKDDPTLDWLSGLDDSNLKNMSGFDVETGDNGAGGGVEFGFGNFDDEKNEEFEDDDEDDDGGDEDFANMFEKIARHTSANILDAQQKKAANLKNTKGKTMAQMANQKQHS